MKSVKVSVIDTALELRLVRSEALSGSSAAVETVKTAVSHPNRYDTSIAGVLGQL